MKSNRTFVKKSGKLQIKEEEIDQSVPSVENGRLVTTDKKDKGWYIFHADTIAMIVEKQTCAFLRDYIPGEFDGFALPKDLDLSEITHTFVIVGNLMEHVEFHLIPLGDTFKAVLFTVEPNMLTLVRVPLLPEQAEIIRLDVEKNGGK